jgi:hypothetical protein
VRWLDTALDRIDTVDTIGAVKKNIQSGVEPPHSKDVTALGSRS